MAKSVLHTIEDNLSTFSKGQKRIGRYILDHYDQAAFMTASKLGKLTEVSESTVVRFAAELGFDGYPAMQKALQEMARNRLTSTQRIQSAENIYDRDVLSSVLQADIENLRQISMDEDRDTFQTAVEKIVHARHIYILGARSSTHLAGYLYFYMQMIFENVTLVQASAAGEIFEQLFRSGEGDVMIAFSFPRYSKDTINAARFARSRGAEIIAITDQKQSPVAQMSSAALLAPTEILAAQHAENLNRMLAPFGMRVALLTGGMKAAARRTTLAAIRKDEADLVVGTHALMSEGVEFARLGLAVIDEQHRFGVRQRGALAEKAANPHLLVMSATPIPRTLGLLIYGDLDISVLDELPPGRTPVKTRCITGKRRQDLYRFLDSEIDKGRQVYLVCPAIEDVPDGGLNAVKTYYEDIAKTLLPDRRVGLMHGKLKPKEKAAVMEDFKAGRLDALVSTTVIEVGVDVPNASVMVIENAERYGLSALHQLRGRVGRGAAESWCFLVSDNTSEAVQKRLKFLCSTTDGFAVAQYDLETRGPGDFFGSRQHGLPTLQIADLMNDTRTLHAAQAEAAALLAADPLLEAPEHSLLAAQVEQMFTKAGAMN